jgi:hypothetical protein
MSLCPISAICLPCWTTSAYARTKKIDPAILLNQRLAPTMYDLTRQVGEANRHAVVACALLAGREPHAFPAAEPDLTELKSRIVAAIDFVQSLSRAEIDIELPRFSGERPGENVKTCCNPASPRHRNQAEPMRALADVQR